MVVGKLESEAKSNAKSQTADGTPILLAAHVVHPDEPAYRLSEMNHTAPDFRGLRRYQYIIVARDGKPAVWTCDLGRASNFAAPQITIPGLWVETVGSLRDVAEDWRNRPERWPTSTGDVEPAGDWGPRMMDEREEGLKDLARRSQFGPGHSKQRND